VTQKTVKTGFRGERKGILTPFTYSPIRRLLPRRGAVVTSRQRRKSGGNLPLAPSKGGMWRREKGRKIRELANLEMRKWGGVRS